MDFGTSEQDREHKDDASFGMNKRAIERKIEKRAENKR